MSTLKRKGCDDTPGKFKTSFLCFLNLISCKRVLLICLFFVCKQVRRSGRLVYQKDYEDPDDDDFVYEFSKLKNFGMLKLILKKI